jgi:hypothetical protein
MRTETALLDAAGYRRFGLVTSAIVIGLFGVSIPWLFSLHYPLWPWVLGGVLGTWSLAHPASLKPVYLGWMKFGNVMNWINTRLILGVMFYGIFLPIGLCMRLFGKDPMQRKLDETMPSYRVTSHNDTKDHLERPY